MALAVDGKGNAVVIGETYLETPEGDPLQTFVTIKYGPDGKILWSRTMELPELFPEPFRGWLRALAIAIGKDSSITIAGESGVNLLTLQ